MMKRVAACFTMACGLLTLTGADWLQFRGSSSNSVVDTTLPKSWSETENLAWTAELPGRGPSSPIVVDRRVVVTCSDGVRHDRLIVLCFDTQTGGELWRRQFWATGRTYSHPSSANAAPTPASDGQAIFAFFSSNDLIALDLDGQLLWYRGLAYDYPKAGNDVGMSSSPVVIGDTVVVQVENQGDSFAAGIDTATGETRWRVERTRRANWTSPAVLPGAGVRPDLVLLQSPDGLSGHDVRSGKELWRFDEVCDTIASPVPAGDRVYFAGGGLTALDFNDQSPAPQLAWQSNRLRPDSASNVVWGERVLALNGGILKCGDAADGETLWQLRIGGKHWATPVIADGYLYCVNDAGDAHVVKLNDERGEIVGTARFPEGIQGTPAVADGAMYVRSDRHLWKISAQP